MNVVVLVKWVPNPDGTPELGPDHLIVREGAQGALDPGDEVGVEAGLQLAERDGGRVVVVSMGPEVALAAVQRALAMGAHGGVLVTDPALRGADALVTARVLAATIARAPFDLVIAGVESTDGYTGTMPMTVAELLGVDGVSAVRKLDVREGELRVERQTDSGYDDMSCRLPAVVTLTLGATEPRYPSLKGIMQAKTKPLERLSTADLGLDADALTSTQAIVGVEEAPQKSGGEVIPAADGGVARIVDLLADAGAL